MYLNFKNANRFNEIFLKDKIFIDSFIFANFNPKLEEKQVFDLQQSRDLFYKKITKQIYLIEDSSKFFENFSLDY